MITPSTIARKAVALPMPESEYKFPEQVREGEGKTPIVAGYYTWGSIQTYGYSGYPNDSRADNWD